MKVISILQPWASLVVLGHKKIETRSWQTKHRGPLLIHASAAKKPMSRSMMLDFQQEFFDLQLPKYETLPFGAIIGSVKVMEILPTETILKIEENKYAISVNVIRHLTWQFSKMEETFGDYSPRRFGWRLKDPLRFEKPTPAKGKLSIWEFDESLLIK